MLLGKGYNLRGTHRKDGPIEKIKAGIWFRVPWGRKPKDYEKSCRSILAGINWEEGRSQAKGEKGMKTERGGPRGTHFQTVKGSGGRVKGGNAQRA